MSIAFFLYLCFMMASIYVIHGNSLFEENDKYLDKYTLKNVATKISTMFKNLILISRTSEKNYRNSMANAMNEIVDDIEWYDHSLLDLNYLNREINAEKKFGNFWDVKIIIYRLNESIQYEYQKFKNTVNNLRDINQTLITIKRAANSEVMNLFQDLHTLITFEDSNDDTTFLQQVFIRTKRMVKNHCQDDIPPLQFTMFEILRSLVSAQLKTFAIDILNYQLRYASNANFTSQQLDEHIAKELAIQINMIEHANSVFGRFIFFTNTKIENCRMRRLIRDVDFIELERVFQMILIPEEAVTKKMDDSICWNGCNNVRFFTTGQEKCNYDYCASCEGLVRDCSSAPSNARICIAENDPRRYEWLELYVGIVSHRYGMNFTRNTCENLKVQSSLKIKFGGVCLHCLCTCEENMHYSKKSTFIISSQIVESDVDKNMVITGVRFIKYDKIVYTQIKQGRLMPGGQIDQSSDHWKPIDFLNYREVNAQLKNRTTLGNKIEYKNFIVISSEVRSVNLNDVYCPLENYVLTGIKLGMSKSEVDNKRIALFIDCHPVNFKQASFPIFNSTGLMEDSQQHDTEVKLENRLPAELDDENQVLEVSAGYHYVKFVMSSWKYDAGQSVLPWLDARDVTSSPSIPLMGIGIFHRSNNKSGGFIAYRIFSIRYLNFL